MECPICIFENENVDRCEICDSDLANPQSEVKVLECVDNALYSLVDNTMSPGWDDFVYLINKRLLIFPATLKGSGIEGRLTAAAYNKMVSKNGVISIPFEDIKSIRDGKMGLLMKALIIDTTCGNLVKIKVGKRDEWKKALEKAITS